MLKLCLWFYFHLLFMRYGLSVPILNDIWDRSISKEGNDYDNFTARVLNFFPVPIEEECNANDGRRKGICMNKYECRIKRGISYGFCAHGFGVCCVFTATCNQEIFNNLTYFVNPNFPDLTRETISCLLNIKKIDEEVAQLRLDFIHFNLGQPNRLTGVCDEDTFVLSTDFNDSHITLCGLNSGQHVYFDVDNINESIIINMNLSKVAVARFWEVRITQIQFSQRAPAGCLQYFEGSTGIIQTMNFADNGRHLANQDYNICIRQEEGMCSIAYEPCHENAFKISPNLDENMDVGSGDCPNNFDDATMQVCNDRITIPCESDELLSQEDDMIQEICNRIHCGSGLCPTEEDPCIVESTVTPFTIGVHFKEHFREESPEDNLGACLIYEQRPCNV